MVSLDGLLDDIQQAEAMNLRTVCDTIHQAYKRDPDWEHPKRFNRNTIALAALQATLATAHTGSPTVLPDSVCAAA
jgi:hypothetical protein